MSDPIIFWKENIHSKRFSTLKNTFQKQLVDWFKQNGRDLPWRKTRDPYAILVSELMLQQTQVDRVAKDYYHQFLARFPTFESIAQAQEEEVIQKWEGLGYYNRAKNLHKLAKEIMEKYHGKFPHTREEILALPGIGEYTAGAVMTFALNLKAPIVDTNVDRVYTRVFLHPPNKLTENQKSKILWLLAEQLLPDSEYWEFNQGIMDLGAMICKTPVPVCHNCPMRSICQYYAKSSLTRFL